MWARIRQIYERNLGGFQSKLWPGPTGDAFFHLVQPDELRDGLVAFGLGMLQGGVAIVVS